MSGVINCIEARQRCRSDGQCRDVLDMLHKICGPELVACATVTPGKCKTLLNTLGKYDYLKSCTCREPHIDFNCYTFREMIFNHPCSLVETAEEHQTYMQTCTDADADCKSNRACFKNYMEFINYCGYSGITCTSQQSDKCNESWKRIRATPRFGCYCPVQARSVGYSGHYDPKLDTKQEKCVNFYNDTHENPCLAGQKNVDRAKMVEVSQAMCHVALEHCSNDPECSRELNNINTWCDHSHCEPDRCRTALQEFYQRVKVVRRLQVAFCVCRQSDHDGECLMAMRKLHPTCAEKHKPKDPMQCHKIAEQCRQNRGCSAKLQQYEQNCAADAITGRCSDTHRSCQQAVMNILGTELHATCVCKGTDFLHQHDCYTWQKLLWSNPCVIESHLRLHEEINSGGADDLDEEFRRLTPAPPTSTQAPHFGPTHGYGTVVYHQKGPSLGPQTHEPVEPETTWGAGRRDGLQVGQTNRGFEPRGGLSGGYEVSVYKNRVGERPHYPEGETHFGRGRVPTNIWLPRTGDHRGIYNHGYRGTGIPIPSQESHHEGPIIEDWGRVLGGRPGKVQPDFSEERELHTRAPPFPPNRGPYPPRTPPNFMPVTPTPTPHSATHAAATPSTSTTITPTTSPTRACTMKDYNLKTVVIPEGTIKRFLKRDSDCSQLCKCPVSDRGQEPEANCITLSCVENKTCQTSRALYPHNTPYYLAYRGVCVCYAGKFICQKPEPGEYTLGPGIYLFLGYSRGEVEILEPHTSTNELEAIKVLESVLIRDYGFQCELRTKHHIGENFIVVAKLQMNPETYISPFVKQRKEKEVCAGPLEEIAKKINSRPRHEDIRTDAILSMFVLAKVDVNLPEPHTSPSHASTLSHASPLAFLLLLAAHLVAKGLLLPARTLT
ncbi:hypothetical protein O3P69_019320 [Scylla paramamosain]|uniref:GDNF/GAS1 domain-containing protein n=1 Tax=Scylla paramamosain TaxID=85552 RepID=A0AAW0SWP3_SCYPA